MAVAAAVGALLVLWVPASEAQTRVTCFELTGKYAVACMQRVDEVCTVYAPKLRHDRDDINFARIGEEVAHCFLGDFHRGR